VPLSSTSEPQYGQVIGGDLHPAVDNCSYASPLAF
jgi:hypothetical protein